MKMFVKKLKSEHKFFYFNKNTAPTHNYTLSLHDALPISRSRAFGNASDGVQRRSGQVRDGRRWTDRKSTRLNSSHPSISYAVFCLKKKKGMKANGKMDENAR